MGRKVSKTGKKTKEGSSSPSKPRVSLLFSFAAGCLVCGSLFQLLGSQNNKAKPAPLAIERLLSMPEEELSTVDIALVNLLCAEGLDDSEDLDIDKCLATLDEWAELIRKDTEARLLSFFNTPAKYDNSLNLFKVVNMVLYLKDKVGIHYDPSCIDNKGFSNPDYIFIHGLLNDKRSGTCTSIPTLCVAIGRRIGYPLKLAVTKGHVFFRWDDRNERFNIESCCIGVDSPEDEHFKTGKYALSEAELLRNHYLKSLSPKEELALFMGNRAACLWDTNRRSEAVIATAWENHLSPDHVPCVLTLLSMVDRNLNEIAEEEYKVTGKPAEYAIDLSYEKENRAYVWRQPVEPQQARSIDGLLKNAQQMRIQNNPLYFDPVAPTLSPQRSPN